MILSITKTRRDAQQQVPPKSERGGRSIGLKVQVYKRTTKSESMGMCMIQMDEEAKGGGGVTRNNNTMWGRG